MKLNKRNNNESLRFKAGRRREMEIIMNNDKLIIGGHEFESRFILGSGKYSMKLIEAAVKDAGAQIITLAVRRANTKEQEIYSIIFRKM